MNIIVFFIVAILILIVICIFYDDSTIEKYGAGAYQSLYSNNGTQDKYLRYGNENIHKIYDYYDHIMPWYLPTRNLDKLLNYLYLHE
jgi:hypothetical protein